MMLNDDWPDSEGLNKKRGQVGHDNDDEEDGTLSSNHPRREAVQ